MSGVENGTDYRPADSITRADYLAMLIRSLGIEVAFPDNFEDVSKERLSDFLAIGAARRLGIAQGRTATEFGPRSSITRQDAFDQVAY